MNQKKLGFKDHAFALRFKAWAVRVVKLEMRKAHPPDAYGTVSTVDYTARRAGVLFGNSAIPVNRPFSYTTQPSVGQTVRVCGRASNRYIAAVVSPPMWTQPTVQNAWVLGATPAQYARDTCGFVHLTGQLTTGAGGTAAFTLPAGFVPSRKGIFSCVGGNVTIDTDGTVTPASTATVWLDGIIFDVN